MWWGLGCGGCGRWGVCDWDWVCGSCLCWGWGSVGVVVWRLAFGCGGCMCGDGVWRVGVCEG